MPRNTSLTAIPPQKSWPGRVKSAELRVISLTQFAITHTRGWHADRHSGLAWGVPFGIGNQSLAPESGPESPGGHRLDPEAVNVALRVSGAVVALLAVGERRPLSR